VPINEPERTEPTNVLLTLAPSQKGTVRSAKKLLLSGLLAALWDPPKFAIAQNELTEPVKKNGAACSSQGSKWPKTSRGNTLVGVPAVISRVWKNLNARSMFD
jgi:hypothetical protein